MDPQMVEEFCRITSAPRDQAEYFLDLAGGSLQDAMALYFDDAGAMPKANTQPAAPAPAQANASTSVQQSSVSAKQTSTSSSHPSAGSSKPKIGSLHTMRNDEDSDEEEGQAFYAGGSEHGSGQQIVGPKKAKTDSRKVVSNVFNAARQLGAEEVHDERGPQPRGSAAFGGAGYRLGSTADPAPSASDQRPSNASSSASEARPAESEVALKFWSNGFSVDDGPLRAFDDPANAEFLTSIRRGDVPQELRSLKRSPTDKVSVRLEDHHEEEYQTSKASVKAFTGSGQKLVDQTPPKVSGAAFAVSPKKMAVNDAQPTTQIQLRLPDGSRATLKCNQSSTLRDIRAHLLAEYADLRNTSFVFASAFPGKVLDNEQQSVKDAGLLNSALVVKRT